MKPENISKVKEAVMDEFGVPEKLAAELAQTAMSAVQMSLIAVAAKILSPAEESKDNG